MLMVVQPLLLEGLAAELALDWLESYKILLFVGYQASLVHSYEHTPRDVTMNSTFTSFPLLASFSSSFAYSFMTRHHRAMARQ